jgi:subtilase family serine protease
MRQVTTRWVAAIALVAVFGMSQALYAGPDLYVSEFSLTPSTPVKGRAVAVRIGVYNQGTAPSGAFTVEWWPGENYTRPALTWRVDSLRARGGRILNGTYDGYPSFYARIATKAVVDTRGEVAEEDEGNNERTMNIRVLNTEAERKPDLYISEFSLKPSTPAQGERVGVRVGVYNRGTAPAGAFKVEWWAGKNFTGPAHTWDVDGLPARGGRILTFTYDGYRSWYANLVTKAVADSGGDVTESEEGNNAREMTIRVLRR